MRRTTAESVGREIRRRRLRSDRTLAEVALASGFDISQLSKIERGLNETTIDGYGRIAKALGVSLSVLVGGGARRVSRGRAA